MVKTMKHKINDMSDMEISFMIDRFIHDDLHREILKKRLIEHIQFEILAEEFNYSVRHIKRIVYKSQDILYSHIKSTE